LWDLTALVFRKLISKLKKLVFVFRKKLCTSSTNVLKDIQAVFEKQDQITDLYRKMCGTRPLNEMSDTGITGLSSENFTSYKSKIKENLTNRFGPYALKELEIASVGTRPNTCYGILMDKAKIKIVYGF